MVLKSYHDGSGKSGETVTLCGIAGTESVWREFEPLWEDVLRKHLVKDRQLHMVDLMSLSRNFSRDNGWDEAQQIALLVDLWSVFGKLRDKHLIAYCCTVLLPDWNKAKSEILNLCSPESICVNFCVGGLSLPTESMNDRKPVSLYFDRGEKFMRKVRRVWERRRNCKGTVFYQIGTIDTVDREYYPLQAADMIAWTYDQEQRGLLEGGCLLQVSLVLCVKCVTAVYDYARIIDKYPTGRLKQTPQLKANVLSPDEVEES
jgi:hypothetical protein